MTSSLVDYEDSSSEEELEPQLQTRASVEVKKNNEPKSKVTSGVVSFTVPALLQHRKRKKDEDSDDEDEDRKKRQDTTSTTLTKLLPPPKNPNISIKPTQQPQQNLDSKTFKQSSVVSLASKLQVQINARKEQQQQQQQQQQTSHQQEHNVSTSHTEETIEESHENVTDDFVGYEDGIATEQTGYFEPSPDFLPKHKRDSFHFQEGAKVIEVNQAELRKGKPGTSQPVVRAPSSFSNMQNYQFNKNQKRKHQITYLAFEASQRETELAEQRAASARSKQQVRAKYGW